jgi:hypothetical protein
MGKVYMKAIIAGSRDITNQEVIFKVIETSGFEVNYG